MRRFSRIALALSLAVVAAFALACGSEAAPTSTSTSAPRAASPSPKPPVTSTMTGSPSPDATVPSATSTVPSATPTVAPTVTAAPPPQLGVALGQRVSLGVGDEVAIEGSPWTVAFDGVTQDSRCPLDVACIQAGNVTAAFVADDGRATQRLVATLEGSGPARVALGGLELSLHAVEPLPLASRPTQAGDYRATISVDRPAPVSRASGIDGLVTLGPLCPVVREDEPCPDRPFEATLAIKDAGGRELARVRSDAAGRFAIDLPPGRYVIEPQPVGTSRLPYASPVEVTVVQAQRAAVLVEYDSGIR
jgi:hypothetical protein